MYPMMSDDANDVSAALAANSDAFARLYDRHAPLVLSLCRRSSSRADAEDAMQETFLRAYRKLHQLDRPAGFGAWLCAIARRVCSERRRSAQRRTLHETQAAVNRPAADCAATSRATAEQAEQLDRLTAALNALPEDERMAVHLHYLTPDAPAAAECLGLSRSGFYRLLASARQRLAALMLEARAT